MGGWGGIQTINRQKIKKTAANKATFSSDFQVRGALKDGCKHGSRVKRAGPVRVKREVIQQTRETTSERL